MNIDKHFLTDTLRRLVRINSVNPDLVAGAPGEKEIASFLERALTGMGIKTEVEETAPGRPNVYGLIRGDGNGRSLMINAHTDTVGVSQMKDPFSAALSNGKLYGRGAQDMKGSIAAMLAMARTLMENEVTLKGDLLLAFVADEEYGSIGTQQLLKRYQTDAAIVTEPTGLDICVAHKGFGLFEITTKGKAAHGGRPDEGIDANRYMGRLIAELEPLLNDLEQSEHPLLGRPSMHIPLLDGGTEPFTYAESSTMKLERRTMPGETLEEIRSELTAFINKLSKRDSNFQADLQTLLWREPFENDRDSPVTSTLFRSVQKIIGKEPSYIGHPWWEDSGLMAKAGIDTVIIGPKGGGLHSDVEWVELESVMELAKILLHTSMEYGNQ